MTTLRAMLLRAILALGLSFSLWAFVSFSQNPEELVPFDGLTPQVTGLRGGLVIVDANGLPSPTLPSVDVVLRTDRNQRTELRPVDIRTVVDLSGFDAGEHVVPVNVQATRSTISFTVPADGVTPSALPVRLEDVVSTTVPIDLKIIGNLPFSFERGPPQISVNNKDIAQVQITGPQNRVQQVVAAQTTANIEQLRASYQGPLTIEAINSTGQSVDGVQINPSTVTIRIPITSVVGLKLVPVKAAITGLPAAGYTIMSVQVDPPLIALTGSSGPLDAVAVLKSEQIDIAGAHSSLVRQARIIFPTGTSPQIGEPGNVQVTVLIAPLSQAFQVALPAHVTLTGIGDGLLASVTPDVVSVTMSGNNSLLDELAQKTVQATVNVSGLRVGSYQIPVTVSLPDGVHLVGDLPLVSVVLRMPLPATTATPTAGPTTDVTAATLVPTGGTPAATETPTVAGTPGVSGPTVVTTSEPTTPEPPPPETPPPTVTP
ncbi:MAG: CdaR family protein [Chloroflexales bacterium]